MASSSNRITGLATGMDIDSIIEETMQAYKTKVNKKKQEKDIVEIKQQLYRDLIKDGQDFYNKYFDITKSDSLLSSKNYKSVAFKSSNDAVATATATSSAVKDNYTVKVEELASTARMDIKVSDVDSYDYIQVEINGNKILINADELKNDVKDENGVVTGKEYKSSKEQAKVINSKLSEYGLKARVSDFSSGNIIIETTTTGSDQHFTVSWGALGTSAIGETVNGTTINNIDEKKFDSASLLSGAVQDMSFVNGGKSVIIKSSDIKNEISDIQKKIDEKKTKMADDTLTKDDKDALQKDIDGLEEIKTNKTLTFINKKLNSIDLNAEVQKDSNGKDIVNITSTNSSKFNFTQGKSVNYIENGSSIITEGYKNGTDLKATITNSLGEPINYGDGTHISRTNIVTLDGVEFNLNSVGETVISGSTDTSELMSKIKSFVEDYNSLVTSLTKYTTENKNRDYSPLTDDQKKEMSDDEITKWNEKVKQGQLKGDNDLNSILNKLKSCVEVTLGSTISLEDIGIEQVDDYSSTQKNNLKIDETKLAAALESNSEEIAKMFTDSDTGIMTRMKNTLYDSFVSSTKSALIQKAGYEGTSYFSQNTLTTQLNEYNKKISEMEKEMKTKEQSLYSKWSNIETAMQKLNSQLSNLQSYFSN